MGSITRRSWRPRIALPVAVAALLALAPGLPALSANGSSLSQVRVLVKGARYSEAEVALRQLLAAKPDSAEGQYWWGVVLERTGRLGEAMEAYRRALKLDRGHGPTAEAIRRLAPERDGPGFPHHAVALQVEGDLAVDRSQITVESPHIHDYTFSTAPTDWVLETGDWRVRSRWSCTPDWNFMGGESAQAAVIWNKREFVGDITVEAYVSNKMNVLGEGGYRNGTDFNVTICGDGRNLASGYSFIVGGWGDSWTRIMKGTKVLAETNSPACRLVNLLDGQPGTWAWHRRWWEVRAVKRGPSLYLFFDNKLALQAQDPDPLPGGRVALWTLDNGILMPRVRVYYETERPPGERGEPLYAVAPSPEEAPPAAPLLTFTSTTHPSIQSDFDHDLGGWARRDGDQGAMLFLDPETPGGQGRSLRLVNENSGGSFGATAVAGPFDAVKLNRLRFDYRVPEALKVNLQLTAQGRRHEIIFTAPDYPSDRALRLATLPEVKADGQWRHVDLDLLACLRRFYPDAPSIEVSDLWFGIDTTRDYILAGFGGNPALCEYRIDNFALIGAGPADGQVQLAAAPVQSTEDGQPATPAWDYLVDDAPASEPDGAPDSTDGLVSLAGLMGGAHYLHARTVMPDGTKGAVYHHEVMVDLSPPEVVEVLPKPEEASGADRLSVRIADAGSGVDPASLVVAVNGQELTTKSPGVSFDPASGTLEIRSGDAGLVFGAGQPTKVSLLRAADWRGNALAQPHEWQFAFDPALDKEPPATPAVALPRTYLCRDTFEDGLGAWQSYSSSIPATLTIDDSTSASGRHSLRVYNPRSGGGLGAVARPEPFDAGAYRIVSFDYKLRPEVRIDLYAVVGGTGYTVQFSNNDGPNKIGTIANVQADDQWRHAEVNLYDLLRAALPSAPGYAVSQLAFLDAGSYGNIQHQYYNLDNFSIAPVFSAPHGLELLVSAGDPSGLAGLSYLVDSSPATEPPAVAATKRAALPMPEAPSGEAWLHCRAEDGAGNWSATDHVRLLVDNAPPTASGVSPANSAVTAVSQVVLSLADTGLGGIDARSLQLEVGGMPYTVDNPGLVYNSSTGQLVWSCEAVSPAPAVFGNGQPVPVRLLAGADYAGNLVSSLPSWTWTMDYSQDQTPPPIASLSCPTHATLRAQTYENGVEQIQPYGNGSSAQVALDSSTPDGTGQSVKITNATAGGNMAVYLVQDSYSSASYPFLSFDYRLPPGTTVDLFCVFYSETLVVRLSDDAGGYSDTIPVQADGQWHHCTYNLHSLIAQRAAQRGLGAYYTISYLGLTHRSGNLAAGAEMNLDNVMVSAAGANTASFSWSATDTTGIAGYSYTMDQSPNTVPPETSLGTATSAQFPNLPAGISYFHVRAQDGAGHWGPTSHSAVLVQ